MVTLSIFAIVSRSLSVSKKCKNDRHLDEMDSDQQKRIENNFSRRNGASSVH